MDELNKEFQGLQSELSQYINEDIVTNIALGVSNSPLTIEEKVEVLKNILKASK